MILQAASADLIQQSFPDARAAGKDWPQAVEAVAARRGVYLLSDIGIAILAIETLGLEKAVELAHREFPRDSVQDLFEEWCAEMLKMRGECDYDAFHARAGELSDYDQGRFAGMVEVYVAYGPRPEMTEEELERARAAADRAIETVLEEQEAREAMGLTDEDVAL